MSPSLLAFLVGPIVVFGAFWLMRRLNQVKPAQAHALVDTGAVLLDVRSKGEFAQGHLPGAVNIPLPTLSENLAAVGDRTRPVVVYCASGMRSSLAGNVLRRAGFAQVADLGPMSRW